MEKEIENPKAIEPVLVDVPWIARALGCSERHVHRMKSAGQMPKPVRLGRLLRWDRKVLEAWIASGCPARRTGC